MRNLLKSICEKFNLDYQFVKFLFVGGINTAVGYGLFAFFLFLKFHYALAVLFATIVGICFNFKTTGSIVFKNSDNKLIFKFFGVYAITCTLNTLCLKVFNAFHFNLYIAGLILVFPMAMVSFLLMKKFVFGEQLTDNVQA